jgi:sugar phosphate isomerase/epimerase
VISAIRGLFMVFRGDEFRLASQGLGAAMQRIKIGVDLASLALPLRSGLQQAMRLGVSGVQLQVTGDLSPRRLSQTGRRELRHLLRSNNLDCASLVCPFHHGLDVAQGQAERIDVLRQAMTLSFELGARAVVVQAGRVPESADSPEGRHMAEALLDLSRHGDRTGAVLALETGLESGADLAAFLARFDTGGLGVCFDPANLFMNSFAVFESARALRGRIALCQAKDARRAGASRSAAEVAVGAGDIDWLQFLATLEEIEYHGWLTVKREGGTNKLADITAGVAFLRRLVGVG